MGSRRNSSSLAAQNNFNSTMGSTFSAINSGRNTFDMTTSGNLNFESTAELKAFATIDITKINKDKSDHLKIALQDNVEEKKKEQDSLKAALSI
jgi:hypothetical protein